MNKQQAKRNFLSGRFHPHCPACGEERLAIRGQVQNNREIWKSYICGRCSTAFTATISEGIDVRV